MHTISEDKLDMLVSGNAPIHLTFFGLCLGVVISFGIVLYNGGLDPLHMLVYEFGVLGSALMAVYFGIRSGVDYVRTQNKLRELKGPKA